jgi:hypothetical protein
VVAAALSLYLFHFYYKHIYRYDFKRQERERLVLKLFTTNVSKEVEMPFRDIGAILKKAQEEKENQKKGKHTTEMCIHTSLPRYFL